MSTTHVDDAEVEEFMGRMIGYMSGGAACLGVWIGDELGLYSVLARDGGRTADEVAEDAGCNPRLVREWLDGQVAAGLIQYDAEADRYIMNTEAAMVLANEQPGRQPPGHTALHRLDGDLHAQLPLAGGGTRARRSGR